MNKPLVSICCLAYNHESYIRECLNGFLMQETDFAFEVLIHDDASTDKTADIIHEYELNHSDIIKPIYQSENQYSKGISPTFKFNFPRAKGKYIALCEGDDYWIDPLKLQKQVEFLEQNPDYGLVHGNCNFYYQEKDLMKENANKGLSNTSVIKDKKELFYRLINADYKVRTATALFRRKLLNARPPNTEQFLMGDTPMWLDFSQMTKFRYFEDTFTVYRILPNSASRSTNKKRQYRFVLSMAEMRIYYCQKYNYPINEKLIERYNSALMTYKLYDPKFKEQYPLFEPSRYEEIKLRLLSKEVFNPIFKMEFIIKKYNKILRRKLKVD